MILWHNGTYKNENESGFSVRDRIRYGDGLFETILCVDGRLIAPFLHLERLYRHAEELKIPIPYAEIELIEAAHDIVRTNGLHQGRSVINIILSRGTGPRGLTLPPDPKPEMYIIVSPVPESYPPVHVIISRKTRRNDGSPLSQMKSFQYADQILALTEATEKNSNEALLLNNQGKLACASTSNLYVLKDQTLFTPRLSDGAMDGIIRAVLLKKEYAREASLTEDDLQSCSGIFLSNSIRGLYPVQSLDGRILPLAKSPVDPHFHETIRDENNE